MTLAEAKRVRDEIETPAFRQAAEDIYRWNGAILDFVAASGRYSSEFLDLLRRMHAIGETRPMMRLMQLATIHEAQARVPRRTGLLQRRIVPGRLTDDTAVIEARTPYAAPVEFGTKPRVIRPKRATVLAWGGERRLSGRLRTGARPTNFATIVHHPGTKAKPYLVPGAKEAVRKVGLDATVKAWNGAA